MCSSLVKRTLAVESLGVVFFICCSKFVIFLIISCIMKISSIKDNLIKFNSKDKEVSKFEIVNIQWFPKEVILS